MNERSIETAADKGIASLAEFAQEVSVVVECLGAQEHLQIADHVHNDKADADQASDGHKRLFADRRAIERQSRCHKRRLSLAYEDSKPPAITKIAGKKLAPPSYVQRQITPDT